MSAELELISAKLRDLRLLILDDNSGDRFLYKSMLADADPGTKYIFFEAESGQDALAIMRTEKLDCVLLDYLLPDMLGLDFLQQLLAGQHLASSPPIIMLTGFGDEATAVKALQSGAHGYIPKRDLNGEILIQAIDRAMRAHKELQTLDKTRQEMAARNQDLESKHKQIEVFYQKILGKLTQPVVTLRDHLAELVADVPGAAEYAMHKQLLNLKTESDRLVATLKNLMDNPALDTGQLLISTRPESMTDVVAGSVEPFRAIASAAGVRLSVNIQPGLPEVSMDRYRIEQVLANVMDNAIKFTPPQGRVFLRVEYLPHSPHEITVSVRDTGRGIRPDKLERLFVPHAQVLSASAEDSTGIGIGLQICREIIHAHKGQISIKSQPEAGTCLTFTLPVESREIPEVKTWQHVIRRNENSQWALNG
jgi:signal transduction histidine kinase